MLLRLLQPAVAAAVVVAVILQKALARLVARRAIERMIEQQVFERRLLRRLHLLAVGDDHRAVLDRRLAAGHQLAAASRPAVRLLLPDLDQAHPATRHDRQRRMPAIVRNLDADPLRRLNAVQPLLGPDLDRLDC